MNIRELRKKNGMNLEKVAEILGISIMQLSRIERNINGMKIPYAQKLGELYKVDWKKFYED